MSKSSKSSLRSESGYIEIKSKFDAEFRRFSVDKNKSQKFDPFLETVGKLHRLVDIPVTITYTDNHGDLLPINNDENFNLALATVKPVLRIFVQRKGENRAAVNGYGSLPVKKRNPLTKILSSDPQAAVKPRIPIGLPEDFRRVSAIIDVDVVPETHRRVKLMKNGSDKPLGFYIRDGTSVRVTPQGLEKVPGIFISRLVPGGLAESTGLLAVNDEVLEVNGIEVCGKTLDQVTDMMVANSSNLIITVKPVNQRLTLAPQRGGVGRYSQMSQASHLSSASGHSRQSSKSYDSDLITEQDDEDEVQDYLNKSAKSNKSEASNVSDKSHNGEKKEKRNGDDTRGSGRISGQESGRGSGRMNAQESGRGSGRMNAQESERGSGRMNAQESGRGSGRMSGQESGRSSGRSTDSGKQQQQKYDKGATKGESDGPIVTL